MSGNNDYYICHYIILNNHIILIPILVKYYFLHFDIAIHRCKGESPMPATTCGLNGSLLDHINKEFIESFFYMHFEKM